MSMGITLTEKAVSRLQDIIRSKGENLALRVMVRGSGCSGLEYGMALERSPRPNDHILEISGIQVVIDPDSLKLLNGSTVDYVEGQMGSGFAINNPNAATGCGCGHSSGTDGKGEQAKGCNSDRGSH